MWPQPLVHFLSERHLSTSSAWTKWTNGASDQAGGYSILRPSGRAVSIVPLGAEGEQLNNATPRIQGGQCRLGKALTNATLTPASGQCPWSCSTRGWLGEQLHNAQGGQFVEKASGFGHKELLTVCGFSVGMCQNTVPQNCVVWLPKKYAQTGYPFHVCRPKQLADPVFLLAPCPRALPRRARRSASRRSRSTPWVGLAGNQKETQTCSGSNDSKTLIGPTSWGKHRAYCAQMIASVSL